MGEDWKVEQSPGRPGESAGGPWCRAGQHHEMLGTTGRNPACLGLHRWKVETAERYHEEKHLTNAFSIRAILAAPIFLPVGPGRTLLLSMPKSRAACSFRC